MHICLYNAKPSFKTAKWIAQNMLWQRNCRNICEMSTTPQTSNMNRHQNETTNEKLNNLYLRSTDMKRGWTLRARPLLDVNICEMYFCEMLSLGSLNIFVHVCILPQHTLGYACRNFERRRGIMRMFLLCSFVPTHHLRNNRAKAAVNGQGRPPRSF